MKLSGPAWRKEKEKDINWEVFLSNKEMDKFEYNQVIRTTLHADAATGGFP